MLVCLLVLYIGHELCGALKHAFTWVDTSIRSVAVKWGLVGINILLRK